MLAIPRSSPITRPPERPPRHLALVPRIEAVAAEVAWPHLVALRVAPRPAAQGDDSGAASWLAVCRRLTPRVERTGPRAALLDLGPCTDAEALAALAMLRCHLFRSGYRMRAGVGPTGTVAQLALSAPPSVAPLARRSRPSRADGPPRRIVPSLALVAPDAVLGFLHSHPVAALARLHPRGCVTPEVVARLQRYGLATLGHVARLEERTLRRQFGAALGTTLAAVARGDEVRPIQPTPPPATLRLRHPFDEPVPPDLALAALPALAERVAACLGARERLVRTLYLDVRCENGRAQGARAVLRRHTADRGLLAAELRRLLLCLLGPVTSPDQAPAIVALRLTLADFAPAIPTQGTFWLRRERRAAALAKLEAVGETLARRHGRHLLLMPVRHAPEAIFAEDRYRLTSLLATDAERLAPTGTEGPRIANTATARRRPPTGDPWREVPQRLHWW